ncbi:hypothetical protein, partial [Halomonas sp.]|uniref:hypothetical protein n=1 Tax=Halomonas sp. TaxID=1486246 RepID=UPI00298D754B
ERQAPSAKRQAPSAKRQAPSAKRQAPQDDVTDTAELNETNPAELDIRRGFSLAYSTPAARH